MPLFSLYLAQRKKEEMLFLSPEPCFDLTWLEREEFSRLFLIGNSLPAGVAAGLFLSLTSDLRLKRRKNSRKSVQELLLQAGWELRPVERGRLSLLPDLQELKEIAIALSGRLLRSQELACLCGYERDSEKKKLSSILQALCLSGQALFLPALLPLKGDLFSCRRCGWQGIPQRVVCSHCGQEDCCVCPDCLVMGGLRLCDALYTAGKDLFSATESRRGAGLWRPFFFLPEDSTPKFLPLSVKSQEIQRPRAFSLALNWEVELTPAQKAAVEALRQFGERKSEKDECLLWAACGAGKTEIVFPIIAKFLREGKRVLFATPRRDVVLELAPRLERAYGRGLVAALYGGCHRGWKGEPLVIATTHQILRFHEAFDLVVLDEGDAYPYPGNRMLHFGVQEARLPGGLLVYLTATPEKELLQKALAGKMELIKIPARPHGFPLPEPRFLKCRPLHRGRWENSVLSLISDLLVKGRLFIFVPTVELTRVVGESLRQVAGKPPLENLPRQGVEWSHANDHERLQKRERFYRGEFPAFVTTTIMERGVTVPGVQILVLFADHLVFSAPTLVQIAGRCGRHPDYPYGEVWFAAGEVSREMEEAYRQIHNLNREAAAKGYLSQEVAAQTSSNLWQESTASFLQALRAFWKNLKKVQ